MVINVFMNSFKFSQLNVAKTFMTEESWLLQMSTSAPLTLRSPLTSQTALRNENQLDTKSSQVKSESQKSVDFTFYFPLRLTDIDIDISAGPEHRDIPTL